MRGRQYSRRSKHGTIRLEQLEAIEDVSDTPLSQLGADREATQLGLEDRARNKVSAWIFGQPIENLDEGFRFRFARQKFGRRRALDVDDQRLPRSSSKICCVGIPMAIGSSSENVPRIFAGKIFGPGAADGPGRVVGDVSDGVKIATTSP